MRQEITHLVHDIDSFFAIGNCDMHVEAKDEAGACNLLHVLHDSRVALVDGDELVHPM
jgi:hypothetical protein